MNPNQSKPSGFGSLRLWDWFPFTDRKSEAFRPRKFNSLNHNCVRILVGVFPHMPFIPPTLSPRPAPTLPPWAADALSRWGYSAPNPMQAKLIAEGFLEAPHAVVCAPTASGKTLLALLKLLSNHQSVQTSEVCRTGKSPEFSRSTKGKAVYIVPLKALAQEKHEEFTSALSPFNMTVALAVGDLDSSSDDLLSADVIVATSEKMDSLLRHRNSVLASLTLAVIDEAHLLADSTRGATLEVVMTKLLESGCKLTCMSATVPNARELADWLHAKLFTSTYRPTPLEVGICSSGLLFFENATREVSEDKPIPDLIRLALAENSGKGQALVFVATRKSAESVARELAPIVLPTLSPQDKASCAELSRKALHALPVPTSQCKALSLQLASGVAFHHAGLTDRDRKLIETGFKKLRCLKCIVATTTLAMGIDFPASWVIVRDVKRFSEGFSVLLPALEVAQMVGRAGRPRFDSKGVGVLCCTRKDVGAVRDTYVLGPLENIYSQLSSEPALRMHSLALIATGHCPTFESLHAFFGKTFYAHQYGGPTALMGITEKMVQELVGWDFVREKAGRLLATPVGKRVSELYLDPLSASLILARLRTPFPHDAEPTFPLLLTFAGLIESRPLPAVSHKDEQKLWDELFSQLEGDDVEKFSDDPASLSKYKHAKIVNAWINEANEEEILEQFDMPPGVLHGRMRIQEWLAYSTGELAYVINAATGRHAARRLMRRIKYGVKDELLDLVRIRGIGRVRARKLHDAEITNELELRSAERKKLDALLGEKVAQRILSPATPA